MLRFQFTPNEISDISLSIISFSPRSANFSKTNSELNSHHHQRIFSLLSLSLSIQSIEHDRSYFVIQTCKLTVKLNCKLIIFSNLQSKECWQLINYTHQSLMRKNSFRHGKLIHQKTIEILFTFVSSSSSSIFKSSFINNSSLVIQSSCEYENYWRNKKKKDDR